MEDFWESVNRYRALGLDPLKWVAGCAVKVDLTTVVYPALRMLRPKLNEWGVTISPREDADIFPSSGDGVMLERRVYDLRSPQVDLEDLKRINPSRAVSFIQVHQRGAESPQGFAEILLRLYEGVCEAGINFTVGKGHSIITAYPEAEFACFDFIKHQGGREGWTLANNDTIQVIDPTDDPGSEAQAYVAFSNALNDLITLGCYEDLRLYPVYDSPTEELSARIWRHMEDYARLYSMALHETQPLGKGKLLIGATVMGGMNREPPIFRDKLEAGMEILVSRPLGDLAPINVYLSCLADEGYLKGLEEQGLTLEGVKKAKDRLIETMMEPNLKIGEAINRYCPEFGGKFKASEHIAATGDLSGPGIYIFKEMAEAAMIDILLDKVPLNYEEHVKFATQNYLLDNATAGTNGAIAVIASREVIEGIRAELSKCGYEPEVMGRVLGRGGGKVYVKEDIGSMISSRSLLEEFIMLRA